MSRDAEAPVPSVPGPEDGIVPDIKAHARVDVTAYAAALQHEPQREAETLRAQLAALSADYDRVRQENARLHEREQVIVDFIRRFAGANEEEVERAMTTAEASAKHWKNRAERAEAALAAAQALHESQAQAANVALGELRAFIAKTLLVIEGGSALRQSFVARAEAAEAKLARVEALRDELATTGDPEWPKGEIARYFFEGNDADIVERLDAALDEEKP